MSRNLQINESQLSISGYRETSPGVWGKDDSENQPGRSPAVNMESDTRGQAKGSAKTKKGREAGDTKRPGCPQHVTGDRYRLIITSYRTRLMDPSNPCFKAIEDTLTNNGIWPDDSAEFCDQPIFIQHKTEKGLERTDVEVLLIQPIRTK